MQGSKKVKAPWMTLMNMERFEGFTDECLKSSSFDLISDEKFSNN